MSAIDTRGPKRESLFFMAELQRDEASTPEKVKIRNLSDGGVMVDGGLLLESGDRVIVTIKNVGSVGGRVAWVQGSRTGITFDRTIDSRLARSMPQPTQKEAPRYARPAVTPLGNEWNVRRV